MKNKYIRCRNYDALFGIDEESPISHQRVRIFVFSEPNYVEFECSVCYLKSESFIFNKEKSNNVK